MGYKSFKDKAWDLQYRIENRVKRIKPLSFEDYMGFLGMIFLLTGIMLFLFCFLNGVNPLYLDTMSSPLQYIGLGLICFSIFICIRRKRKLSTHK